MSSDPTLPPAGPAAENGQAPNADAVPAQQPSSMPMKPLLNPLQNDSTPPSSTIAEPPRSPNPQNPVTDDKGNNADLDLPSASASVVGAGEMTNGSAEQAQPIPSTETVSEPVGSAPPSSTVGQPALPPLPTDAPVPPTPPQPKDEAPPTLPPGAIPPAVSTPTVITTETPAAPEPTPLVESAALPESSLASQSVPKPESLPPASGATPAPAAPAVNGHDSMAVDPPAPTAPTSAPDVVSEGSLKRSGEELQGREEKRVKDEGAAPAETVTAAPALPAFDPNGPPPWLSYTEPAPRPAGPTTPLTMTQHKYLLSSIRSLKKMKEAVNFLNPVDVVLFGIPHYAQIITKPMDLSTVEQKLIVSDPRGPPKDKSKMSKWDESKGKYGSVAEVVGDVRQIWENTRKFNGPNHVVSLAANKLDDSFEKMLRSLPVEPIAPPAPSPALPSPAAGPSTNPRRPSISQVPAARRSSDGPDSSRPKREIHPPPSKDLGYNDGTSRKPKRRNDPQLQWASRALKSINEAQKNYDTVTPFLFPVEQIIQAIPAYTDVIKQPIDLLKIKGKLDEGEYDDVTQVDADIRLMVRNAQLFNPREDPVHIAAGDYLNLWIEKMKSLPPKQDARDLSEDPLADDFIEDESDEEDARLVQKLEDQIVSLQAQIAEIRSRRAARRNRPKKTKKAAARKQSISKPSGSPGANGHLAKKPRKSRDAAMYQDDEEMYSEEETGAITLSQKQELAEKIGQCDPETLSKAIQIIQQTTDLGSNNEDIELDIDTLPARTVTKLYNLVVRGGRKAPKNKNRPLKKTGRKATGGANRKFMNEDEEADRIRKMEAQLQSFDTGRQASGYGYDEDDESSEEESSDED